MNSQFFRQNRHSQTGFGLLEVLVSLVIFASVGFTLLAWFQQSVDSIQRLRGFYEIQDARKIALEIARTINPMQQPKGEVAHGALRIVWETIPEARDESIQTGYPRGIGRHRLRLYNASFSVFRDHESTPLLTEKITLIGHRLDVDSKRGINNE